MPQNFRELNVWQKAVDLTVSVYELTREFPKDEIYGLTSQLRRAAVSVASNIAEGRGRLSRAEFRQFLAIALGSTFEVQTQLLVTDRLHIAPPGTTEQSTALSHEVSKMLTALLNKLGSTQVSLRANS